MGLNGVDNAKFFFDNVRVPRENLLNLYSDVDEDGSYSTNVEGSIRKRFLTVADQLLSGRPCIASMSQGKYNTVMLFTAWRHSSLMVSVIESGLSGAGALCNVHGKDTTLSLYPSIDIRVDTAELHAVGNKPLMDWRLIQGGVEILLVT